MVSIIVPAYNAERYLPEAVASVISQSVSDWELLLVDDGSTDTTPALCDSFAASDTRIRSFHKTNGGLSDARNYGLDHARGDFIAFLDADDILHPDFLWITLSCAAKHKSASHDFIVAVEFAHFSDKSPFGEMSAGRLDVPAPICLSPSRAVEYSLYQTPLPDSDMILDNSAWGKLYPAGLWEKVRFTKGIWYEDMDIFYRAWRLVDSVVVLPVRLIGYRQHPASFLHTFTLRRADALDVTDRMLECLTESSLHRAARVRRFAAHCNILTILYANRANAPEIEARCLRVIRSDRGAVLRNGRARAKDRIGALIGYLPVGLLRQLLPRLNKSH